MGKHILFPCSREVELWNFNHLFLLPALMYSPNAPEIVRNTANDNAEGVLTLANFLQFAKSNPGIGIYIDIQVCRINS
jgi:hypothetical protein